MSKITRATIALTQAGIVHTVHLYEYDPDAEQIGLQAAAALGVEPQRVLKTLMANVDGKGVCAIIPSDCELSMKKLAMAFGGKHAQMMKPSEAERLSGYRVGGISPFAQQRRVLTAIECRAFDWPQVYLNGGQRGVQLQLDPRDAARLLSAISASLIASDS
jgi:Cys-tRNA(Pro)/Cys-tRNA(Cys) deacylase